MNALGFASSRASGWLVVTIVVLVMVALVVASWTLEEMGKARRLSRAQELRLQRANRQRLRAMAQDLRRPTASERRMADSAQRARAAGVDELQLEDDFAGFAEYGGGLRH